MPRDLKYTFKFEDDTSLEFDLHFDENNNFINKHHGQTQEWTKLSHHQC